MNKWIGAVVLAAAGFFLVMAGDDKSLGLLLTGIGLGIVGLAIWDRTPQVSVPAVPETPPADRQIARMEEVLLSLQEDVRQLREDREFFHELYSGREEARVLPGVAPSKSAHVR